MLINCLYLTVTIITGITIPISNLNKIWTDIASTVVLLPLIIASCMQYQHKQLQTVGQWNLIRLTSKMFLEIVFRLGNSEQKLWSIFYIINHVKNTLDMFSMHMGKYNANVTLVCPSTFLRCTKTSCFNTKKKFLKYILALSCIYLHLPLPYILKFK